MNNNNIKTRFSPSPTGKLHIGGARTALYNFLFAKHYKGKFILRIEDSDINRSNKKYIKNIVTIMRWLKLYWDEGPYFQTKRLERYQFFIKKMLKQGTAYKCFCSKERLNTLKKKQISLGKKPKYDKYCFFNKSMINKHYVIRFNNPLEGSVNFIDQIRGLITFKNSELDDLIICRSNGLPTYNFCVVIDDYDMNITHIIRGEEHINNTPRQINILKAIGANIPIYAHISMILDENRHKLSKRSFATSIDQYYNEGYLQEAIINYLSRLGWSYGNKEIFNINELKNFFCIDNINKSSCIFDIKKLQWLNHYYIKSISPEKIAKRLIPYMKKENLNILSGPSLIDIVKIFNTRCKTLKEIVYACKFFYVEIKKFDFFLEKKYLDVNLINLLKFFYNKIEEIKIYQWDKNNIKKIILSIVQDFNLKEVKIINVPIRIAVTGKSTSPELYTILYLLGKKSVLKRIDNFINFLKNKKN